MSSFFAKLDQAQSLLEKSGRVSLRALQREYSLADDELEDLIEELVDVREVATRNGNILEWVASAAATATLPTEGGERRQLTVMFCDLVGSTTLAQQVDPEELSQIITAYREICDEATDAVQGHVAQYLGDGVMIYFGYPQAQEDAADRAIRAGLEIQRLLSTRNDDRIKARIGIHTGAVVVDRAATGDKALALGSTTNVAARIEGMAQPGSVLVSSATLANCRGAYSSRSLGEVALKGVEEAVELLEINGVEDAVAVATSATHPMLGRDDEIASLEKDWARVRKGKGRTVVLIGDAGIGKSRLIQAMRENAAPQSPTWLDMQCSPFTSGSAFQPIINLQRAVFRLAEAESPNDARDRLVSSIELVAGVDHANVVPYLLALLQLPPSEKYPITETSTDEQRERTIRAMLAMFLAITDDNPVVVVIEDLHWVDPSTLEFLSRLIDASVDQRLMLIATSRPTHEPDWSQQNVSKIRLKGLSPESTRQMIRHTAGAELPDDVLDALANRSDGVPLFINELTVNVVGSGSIVEQDGNFRLRTNLSDLAIPMTLQDSLMARLDRLNTSKIVAQQAATLGREFSYPLIASIVELDPAALESALAELIEGGILTVSGDDAHKTYTFTHALIQDAAYESQLHSTRKSLHARIVDSLRSNFPLQAQSEPEVVARHCAAAGMHSDAMEHYHRAAELAEKRLSNKEAVHHYELALISLEALSEDDNRVQKEITLRLAQNKAEVALYGYEHKDVIANINRIEELCNGIPEGPNQLPALLGLVQLDLAKGANFDCRERGSKILEIAEPLGIPFVLGVANLIMGGTNILLGDSIGGRDRLKSVVEMPELAHMPPPATSNDLELLSTAWTTYATALANCGELDQSRRACDTGVARARKHGNDISIVQALSISALCGYIADDPQFAIEFGEEAVELAEGRGFHTPELMATFPLGWAYAVLGDLQKGLRLIERGLNVYRKTGAVSGIELLHLMAADAYRLAGYIDQARNMVDAASRLAENRTVGYQGRILISRAKLELQDGDVNKARQSLLEAYTIADKNNWLLDALLTATQLGKLATDTNDAPEAHARLVDVYARVTEGTSYPPMVDAAQTIDELRKLVA